MDSPTHAAVAQSAEHTLETEARRNEVRIGWVRAGGFGLVLVLDGVLAAAGTRPASNIAHSAVLLVMAALMLVVVHRARYRPWFRFAIPLVDAVLAERMLVTRMLDQRTVDQELPPGLIAAIALGCGLFAATGGLRLDRKAAVWTTLLAGALFWRLLGETASAGPLAYSLVILMAIGMLGVWTTDLVRRTMRAARGRAFLRRFLPRGLVDAAFRDPLAALDPKAVEATVLVSDMRGFTSLAETIPPVEVLGLLNRLQGALAAAVQKNGGVVDKFMGDGMLAVFGAPDPVEDHAERAIRAARDIRAAVREMNATAPQAVPLRVGIGIHSGSLVAGCLGGGDRLEFTVVGDAVNTASRLESMTKEKGIGLLLSGETAALLGSLELLDLGEVVVRGRRRPLHILTLPEIVDAEAEPPPTSI
jgi:adenylate cyclase